MKFLVFQHVPNEHPGLIAKFAKDHDLTLDVVEFWKPYSIPDLSEYVALILMGGPMGVYESDAQYPSKHDELRAIKEALDRKMPILGFCLGGQLLAHVLGADVYPNIVEGKKVKEIGYYDIALTNPGKRDVLFENFSSPIKVLEWHGDVFDVPQNATLLASSSLCPNQAFVSGNAYGLLFHFEFTPEMVKEQIRVDNAWIHADHDVDEKLLMEAAKANEELMKHQCQKLLSNFLSIIDSAGNS